MKTASQTRKILDALEAQHPHANTELAYRTPFAGETPTEEEAQAARNYLGYYGALGVYPGEVFHNILGGVSPTAGAILRRFAKVTGDELVVTLPSGNPQSTTATIVRLRRLSGADDMLPRSR